MHSTKYVCQCAPHPWRWKEYIWRGNWILLSDGFSCFDSGSDTVSLLTRDIATAGRNLSRYICLSVCLYACVVVCVCMHACECLRACLCVRVRAWVPFNNYAVFITSDLTNPSHRWLMFCTSRKVQNSLVSV